MCIDAAAFDVHVAARVDGIVVGVDCGDSSLDGDDVVALHALATAGLAAYGDADCATVDDDAACKRAAISACLDAFRIGAVATGCVCCTRRQDGERAVVHREGGVALQSLTAIASSGECDGACVDGDIRIACHASRSYSLLVGGVVGARTAVGNCNDGD